jgi:hypothetical protein
LRRGETTAQTQNERRGGSPDKPRGENGEEQAGPEMLHADRAHAGNDLGSVHQSKGNPEERNPAPGLSGRGRWARVHADSIALMAAIWGGNAAKSRAGAGDGMAAGTVLSRYYAA